MSTYKLQFKPRISRRASHEMILMLAKHSNHREKVIFRSDADVKRYLAKRGVDFQTLVEHCRNFKENVPFFENLIGGTIDILGNMKINLMDKPNPGPQAIRFSSNSENNTKDGSGVNCPAKITISSYLERFEAAYIARNRAVEAISYSECQSAIVAGIASIEAYITYRAKLWNKNNPDDFLTDSGTQKVSIEEKIDSWIPKMTHGKKVDKSNRDWKDFIELKKIRDYTSIHSKNLGYGISYLEIAEKINKFKTGIAGILMQLHFIFEEKIPAKIIRAKYSPEVEVINVEAEDKRKEDEKSISRLMDQATKCHFVGEHKKAIVLLDTIIKIKPDYHIAWSNKGVALKELGRYNAYSGPPWTPIPVHSGHPFRWIMDTYSG